MSPGRAGAWTLTCQLEKRLLFTAALLCLSTCLSTTACVSLLLWPLPHRHSVQHQALKAAALLNARGGREAVPSGTPQDLTLVPWVLTHGKSFGSRKTAPLSSDVCPGQSFISCGGGTHMPGGIRTGQADAMLPKPCISCGSGFLSKSWHPWIFLPFNIKTSQLR